MANGPGTDQTPRFSRRTLAAMTAAGALGGGIWTVGLTAIHRSAERDLTIVGSDTWQVALLESGTDRILFLIGTVDPSQYETEKQAGENLDEAIRKILSSFRWHVDLVVATGSMVTLIDRDRHSLRDAVWIQVDAEPTQPDLTWRRGLRQHLEVRFSGGKVILQRVPQHEWSQAEASAALWVGTIDIGSMVVTIADDLVTAANSARAGSAMLMAPVGDTGVALSLVPDASVVANGYGLTTPSVVPEAASGYLVRTFPDDSARLGFRDDEISLPDWAQPLKNLAR